MYQVKIQTTSLALRQISSRDHLYHNMWSARNPAILLQKKLLDEVIYTFITICSQTTTKASGKISIFPIQLTKKGTFS